MNASIAQIILQERRMAYVVTDPNLQIIELNGCTEIICAEPVAVQRRKLLELVPELAGCEEILADILVGKLSRFQLNWINREQANGQTMYLSMIILPYYGQTEVVTGLLHVIEDLTEMGTIEQRIYHQHNELRLLQDQLAHHNQELAHANIQLAHAVRAKDDFLASMSHELRTPLTAILGLIELLENGYDGPVNDQQLHSLHRIHENGLHLLALINDILDIARIEAGKLTLEITPTVVEDLCQTSVRMIKPAAQKKQLSVGVVMDSAVTLLLADARRLKQILVNLLSNAVKFTPDHGAIGLEVRGDRDNQAVHFTVWDTGIGIAPEDLPCLFEPFVQLDSSLSRQYNGTGLGLTLTRRLVDMHAGSLAIESTPGRGSRFTVSLPWHAVEEVSKAEPDENVMPAPPPATTQVHPAPMILLAEDNTDNSILIARFLRTRGYRTITVPNGEEALNQAQAHHPDVILMDIQMPGMDGLEATRRLRANPTLRTIPVIALTALAMPGDRERCFAAGVSEYLSKPISFKKLFDAIEFQLQRTRSVGGSML